MKRELISSLKIGDTFYIQSERTFGVVVYTYKKKSNKRWNGCYDALVIRISENAVPDERKAVNNIFQLKNQFVTIL
jgi:hypothetical protein